MDTPLHKTTEFDIIGMTCASCVGRVEKALARVEGVELAQVNLATERATVRHGGEVSLERMQQAIAAAGYESRSHQATDSDGVPTASTRPVICLLYTSPSPRDGLLSRMPSSA